MIIDHTWWLSALVASEMSKGKGPGTPENTPASQNALTLSVFVNLWICKFFYLWICEIVNLCICEISTWSFSKSCKAALKLALLCLKIINFTTVPHYHCLKIIIIVWKSLSLSEDHYSLSENHYHCLKIIIHFLKIINHCLKIIITVWKSLSLSALCVKEPNVVEFTNFLFFTSWVFY